MKKKGIILLVVVYLSFIALGLPDALLGSAWNLIRTDLNVSLGTLGLMTVTIYIMSILSTLNAPRLLRLIQTKKITFISIFFTGSALVLMSQVTSFYQMLFFALPLGVGAGAIDVSLNHYLAKNYQAKHMNFLHSFYGIGVTLGPSIMAVTLKNDAWRIGYIVVGLILVGISLCVLFSFKLWHQEHSVDQKEEHTHIPLKEILKVKGSKVSIIIFLLYVHVESLSGVWIASYFFIIKEVSYSIAALFTTIYFLSLTLGRLLSAYLSQRIKPKRLVVVGSIFILVGGSLLLINPFSGLWSYVFVTALIGFGCAPIYPNMMFLNNDYFKRNQISRIMSLQMAIGYMGFGLLTPLAGLMFEKISISLYPWLLTMMGLCLLIMVIQYFKNEVITDL